MRLRNTISYRRGISFLQKVTAVFQMIANGVAADATDEYVRVSESTAL
jgi:hypothetical protein